MTLQRMLQRAVVLAMVASCTLLPAVPAAGASSALVVAASLGTTHRDRPMEGEARLLSSSEGGVTFEIAVPWEHLRAEPVESDYVQVSIPGWATTSQAGAPAVPLLAEAIGVPLGVKLGVHAEPGPAHTMTLPAPALPVATQVVDWDLLAADDLAATSPKPRLIVKEDAAVYAGERTYPGALAEIASDGMVRQQRVAGIVAYPVQYNPATRELTVYEWLRIEVTFEGLPTTEALRTVQAAESPAYQNLFRQELLNDEAARAWRQPTVPTSVLDAQRTGEATAAGAEALPWAPPVPGWRVKVREEGLYKLTYAELQAAGLPVDTLDPRTFQLFNLGSEVAIYVEGENDGNFGGTDYILFYGQPVASKYTRDNVYWLTYGQETGARMAVRDGTPAAGETPAHYPAQRHLEGNAYYFSNTPGHDALERFMWDYLYPPSRPSWSHAFALAAPYAGDGTATLTVAMLGYLDLSMNPDHHAQVYLNGTQVGDVWWDGIAWQESTFDVPQNLLVAGDNTLHVVGPNDTGAGYDIFYIDWAELGFANTFLAEADALPFSYDEVGTWQFRVDGFSTNQVAVYDVTYPAAVVRIEGVVTTPSGSGYAASFQDGVTAATNYLAVADTAYRSARFVEPDTPSSLQSTGHGADYVLITHPAFAQQAATLRDLRASQGLRAALVDVQDVYDEFGYGMVGAAAIRGFLAYAYGNWQPPAPSYVLLVGDGHYDPKNYLGYGRVSYIPPYLAAVDPWITETAADNRYVTLVGDDTMPDMMLGRLAVNSGAEASIVVDKILAYESLEPSAWQQQVLAVADNADYAGNFAQSSDALLSGYLPAPYTAQKVYYGVTHTTVDGARTAIQEGINAGKLIVNYIGHGGVGLWAGEGLLKTADVPNLQNGDKLPVVLSMTCYDGSYHYPSTSSAMAEALTGAEGKGAVASWSPTGLGVATGHDYLDRGFFQAVFQESLVTLGEATVAGKLNLWASAVSLDLLDTYLLFGDPAMTIALAETVASADLVVDKTVNPTGSVGPGDMLEYTLTFVNNGPDTATGVVLNDPMPAQLLNPEVVDSSGVVSLRADTTFVWDVADLAAGSSGWVTVRGTIDPDLVLPATIVNTAQMSAGETDPVPANNSASVSTEVEGSAPGATMHVADLDGFKSSENKKFWWASVSALILDQNGDPVANATVSGAWSGGTSGTSSCVTDSAGLCTCTSGKVSGSSASFTVTDVAHVSVAYDASQNVLTSITVYKDAPVNQPPVAAFTYACDGLTCTFDARGSSDADGTIVSYAWNFGDGNTGSGAVIHHDYGAASTYSVVLTVTDDGGAKSSETQIVPVGVEPGVVYVADIAMSGGTAGANRFATAVVTIVDSTGNPVEGAIVYGDWSGDYSGSVQGTTGADGTVTFTSGKARVANATFTFTVSDVVKDGFSYDAAKNIETSDLISVP